MSFVLRVEPNPEIADVARWKAELVEDAASGLMSEDECNYLLREYDEAMEGAPKMQVTCPVEFLTKLPKVAEWCDGKEGIGKDY